MDAATLVRVLRLLDEADTAAGVARDFMLRRFEPGADEALAALYTLAGHLAVARFYVEDRLGPAPASAEAA